MSVQGSPSDHSPAIVIHDILVGDVWVASGQSNMEFPMERAATAAEDLPHADNPRIRLMIVNKRASDFPQDDVDTDGWAASSPDSAKEFSAVAWYFAREIEQREHVPVGVIDSTWGGTVAESWVRLTALGEDPALNPLFASRGKMLDKAPDTEYQLKEEQRQRDEAKAEGKPAPQFPWHPPLASWGPGLLWNGMIAPLTPLPIRGAIWYQGESNSALERFPHLQPHHACSHRGLAPAMGCGRVPVSLRADLQLQVHSARRLGQPAPAAGGDAGPDAIPRWPSPSTSAIQTMCIPPTKSMSGTVWPWRRDISATANR